MYVAWIWNNKTVKWLSDSVAFFGDKNSFYSYPNSVSLKSYHVHCVPKASIFFNTLYDCYMRNFTRNIPADAVDEVVVKVIARTWRSNICSDKLSDKIMMWIKDNLVPWSLFVLFCKNEWMKLVRSFAPLFDTWRLRSSWCDLQVSSSGFCFCTIKVQFSYVCSLNLKQQKNQVGKCIASINILRFNKRQTQLRNHVGWRLNSNSFNLMYLRDGGRADEIEFLKG